MALERKIKKIIENADELGKFLDVGCTDFGDIIWYFDEPLWEWNELEWYKLEEHDLMSVRENCLKLVQRSGQQDVYFNTIFVSVSDDRCSLFLTSLAESSYAGWNHSLHMFLFDFIFDKGYVEFFRMYKGIMACNGRLTLHGAVGVLMDWVFRECLIFKSFDETGRLVDFLVEKETDLTKAVLDYVWYDLDDGDEAFYAAGALPSFAIADEDILYMKQEL